MVEAEAGCLNAAVCVTCSHAGNGIQVVGEVLRTKQRTSRKAGAK